MANVGYARLNTTGQNLEVQLNATSGINTERYELIGMLDYV